MAVVGDILTAAEAGWRRYDNTASGIQYTGAGWAVVSDARHYSGSMHYTATLNTAKVVLRFYGTKIRFLASTHPTHSTDCVITIDGVVEHYTQQGAERYQVIQYEKKDLTLGYHTVEVYSANTLGPRLDAIDVDDFGYITTAVVGQALTAPETGWKRYDNKEPSIAYTGTWSSGIDGVSYAGTYTWSNTVGASASFKFKGTRLRIITDTNSGADNSVKITIDGVVDYYSQQTPSTLLQVFVFEKKGLSDGIHQVSIERQTGPTSLDAVDIDDNGYILGAPPATTGELRHTLREMKIGDYAHIYWDAVNSKWVLGDTGGKMEGYIGGIAVGTQQDYYVFAVKVAKGLLVTDRTWYHSSSWDQLNTSKLIEGQPATLTYADDNSIAIPITVRSLRGGVAYATADGKSSTTNTNSGGWPATNEWDQYLNRFPAALIQAGKTTNDIFHHTNDGVNPVTWVQETPMLTLPSSASAARVGRRGWDFGYNTSNITTATLTGYRPVFEYKEV